MYIYNLQDALDPAMRLSLKLQRSDVTLCDSLCWIESTMEILQEKKGRYCSHRSILKFAMK